MYVLIELERLDSIQCMDEPPQAQLTSTAMSSFCQFRDVLMSVLECFFDAISFWLFKERLPLAFSIGNCVICSHHY